MSKYWNKMEILRQGKQFLKNQEEKEKNKDLFISQNKPAFFVNKDYYKVKTSSLYIFSVSELQQLSDFYCKNYRIGKSNNTIMLYKNNIENLLNINCELLTIYEDKNLIGSIISIIVPLYINIKDINNTIRVEQSERSNFYKQNPKKNIIFACSSFLILGDKYRGKGLGMALIQESLQILYENGGLGAYFINTVSRCDNSIPLFSWYYPLNLQKLDACKFNYPKDYKTYFNLEKIENIVKVDIKNSKQSYDFYFDYMKDKNIYFSPSYEYWQKWIESFPTYILFQNEKIIGLFSFNSNYIRYSSNELNMGILLICIGEQPITLKSALYASKNLFDIITLYETGELTKKILKNVFAQNSHKSYINFFNTRIKITSAEFYCPLF